MVQHLPDCGLRWIKRHQPLPVCLLPLSWPRAAPPLRRCSGCFSHGSMECSASPVLHLLPDLLGREQQAVHEGRLPQRCVLQRVGMWGHGDAGSQTTGGCDGMRGERKQMCAHTAGPSGMPARTAAPSCPAARCASACPPHLSCAVVCYPLVRLRQLLGNLSLPAVWQQQPATPGQLCCQCCGCLPNDMAGTKTPP